MLAAVSRSEFLSVLTSQPVCLSAPAVTMPAVPTVSLLVSLSVSCKPDAAFLSGLSMETAWAGNSLLACFCQPASEVPGRGPRPAWLRVDGGGKNLLILLAFSFRPGFDEQDQLGARNTVSHLQAMGGQPVARGLRAAVSAAGRSAASGRLCPVRPGFSAGPVNRD